MQFKPLMAAYHGMLQRCAEACEGNPYGMAAQQTSGMPVRKASTQDSGPEAILNPFSAFQAQPFESLSTLQAAQLERKDGKKQEEISLAIGLMRFLDAYADHLDDQGTIRSDKAGYFEGMVVPNELLNVLSIIASVANFRFDQIRDPFWRYFESRVGTFFSNTSEVP